MASNPYVNKVVYDNTTLIDVTDTTAEASDVVSGKVFTLKSGAKATGTANYMPIISNPTGDKILVSDSNGEAVESSLAILDVATVNVVHTLENTLTTKIDNTIPVKIDFGSFSTLPQTVTDSRITNTMEIDTWYMNNPAAQLGEWDVSTSNGSVTISGTISGTTSLVITLQEVR